MPSQQNVDLLNQIKDKKNQSKATIFAHYRGLGVNQLNELRDKIREVGGELLVTKNTLLRLAYNNKDLDEALQGPTAAVFAYEDEVAPLKVVADFSKDNELPEFTAGYFDDKALTADQVIALSKLPGKQELQAKVVGSLAAPLSGMVNVLQGNIRNLVYVLGAIKNSKN
ncbi:50S ribosomal protein L10 [Candidatus Beckwithbacteria bacterium]|nr:50S ribosomal protein L10 [Candidatus Beckwithbacteria bacterium]